MGLLPEREGEDPNFLQFMMIVSFKFTILGGIGHFQTQARYRCWNCVFYLIRSPFRLVLVPSFLEAPLSFPSVLMDQSLFLRFKSYFFPMFDVCHFFCLKTRRLLKEIRQIHPNVVYRFWSGCRGWRWTPRMRTKMLIWSGFRGGHPRPLDGLERKTQW